jgi:transcriptional regulator with XRE-family HTH domain
LATGYAADSGRALKKGSPDMGDSPAVARRRVRLAVRNAREAKGLTQSQVAEAMGWSLSKVLRMEKGEVSISAGDLRMLLPYLGIKDPAAANRLIADARASRRQRWVFDQQLREHLSPATLELMQLETEATAIRYFQPLFVPGLLQTRAYATAIFGGYSLDVEKLPQTTIKVRLEERLQRRKRVLHGPNRPDYLVLLDESVLFREFGGPGALGDQLDELLRAATGGETLIRILPFRKPSPVALLGPFGVLDMGDDQDAVLYLERHTSDEIDMSRRNIVYHRETFELMWSAALDDRESMQLIRNRADVLLGRAG